MALPSHDVPLYLLLYLFLLKALQGQMLLLVENTGVLEDK